MNGKGCPVCFGEDVHGRILREKGICRLCQKEVSVRSHMGLCLTCQAEENLFLERKVAYESSVMKMIVGAISS